VIDPAQAFGTGAHATTRLCLELLLELDARGPLLDLGCGSGVLAVVASKLGFAPVTAVDFDPLSVEATRENAAVNGVPLTVARCDLRSDPIPAAPTVAANLLAPLHSAWAERLLGGGAPLPGIAIASGLLEHEAGAVASAFAAAGLTEDQRRTDAGWAALLLRGS
jgi:ribosomal protein L11 methyltransferase